MKNNETQTILGITELLPSSNLLKTIANCNKELELFFYRPYTNPNGCGTKQIAQI